MHGFCLIAIFLEYNKIHPKLFLPLREAMHCNDCEPGSPGSPLCSVQDDKPPLCKWKLDVKYFERAAQPKISISEFPRRQFYTLSGTPLSNKMWQFRIIWEAALIRYFGLTRCSYIRKIRDMGNFSREPQDLYWVEFIDRCYIFEQILTWLWVISIWGCPFIT